MKKILLIATGGTIASRPTDNGLAPELLAGDILRCVPALAELCRIDAVQPMNIDSTNMAPDCWLALTQCLREHYNDYDGFVITHGTDTMAYTACALSYLVQGSAKPIVLTGSQKSIYVEDTDARRNLFDAFVAALDDTLSGIYIVFDGRVILGTRAQDANQIHERLFQHRLSGCSPPARRAHSALHSGTQAGKAARLLRQAEPERLCSAAHSRHESGGSASFSEAL